MMFKWKMFFLTVAMGGSLLSLGAPSLAQQDSRPPSAAPQASVSDGDLLAFVRAYVDNQRIRLIYEPQLMTVIDAEDAREIQDEANEELKRSLERQNLNVERYDWIFILVNGDDQLRAKVLQLVYEERKKPR